MTENHRFRFITDWQRLDDATADAIREFWVREDAKVEGEAASRRLHEVVVHAVDSQGGLAAVATVEAVVVPKLGQPMYGFRCFVGHAWRDSTLPRSLLRHSQQVLEPYAHERGYPCLGILAELENPGFEQSLRRAFWAGVNFTYIGRGSNGVQQRIWYFPRARLKSAEEVVAILRSGHAMILRHDEFLSAQTATG